MEGKDFDLEVELEIGDEKILEDYNILKNKPKINGVELRDDKTLEELGIDLNKKAEKEELEKVKENLDSKISGLASGSPKGVYANKSTLESANPDTGVYITTDNGHIYSWTKNGSSAIDLGVYQSTGIADGSITLNKLDNDLKNSKLSADMINEILGNKIEDKQNLSFSDGYYNFGSLSTSTYYQYTQPIFIKKGAVIVYAKGYLRNIDIITACDEDGQNTKRFLNCIDSDAHYYIAKIEKDGYFIFSSSKTVNMDYWNLSTEYFDEIQRISEIEKILKVDGNGMKVLNDKGEYNAEISITALYNEKRAYSTNGAFSAASFHYCSDLIRCYKGQKIIYNLSCSNSFNIISIYDENKNFIRGIQGIGNTLLNDVLVIQENECYIAFSCLQDNLNVAYLMQTDLSNNILNILQKDKQDIDISVINMDKKGISLSGVFSAVAFHSCSDFIYLPKGTQIGYRLRNGSSNYLVLAIYNTSKVFQSGIEGIKDKYMTNVIELQEDSYVRFMTNFDVKDLFITTNKNIIQLMKKLYDLDDDLKNTNVFMEANNRNLLSIFERIGIIGDSLSSGCIEGETTKPSHDIYALSWLSQIKKVCGNEIEHYSRGGEQCKTWLTSSSYTRIGTDTPCQAYFVALGTNDKGYQQYGLGTVNDIGTDNESFYAYYYKVLQRIKEVAPNAKLFLCTLYSADNEYNTAIKYFADNTENAYFVNLSGLINDKLSKYKTGGHFTAIGYKFVASEVINRCYNIIMDNLNDFSNVGLY